VAIPEIPAELALQPINAAAPSLNVTGSSYMGKRRNQRGLTLVELIVAFTIMAILAGMGGADGQLQGPARKGT